jgi:putative SOS response-associated peptidase YedK
MRWGLVSRFSKDLNAAKRPINVRAETVATSGMFRGALVYRRCLVPVDAFYEWKGTPAGRRPGLVGQHARCFGRDQTLFDPWHYVPVRAFLIIGS